MPSARASAEARGFSAEPATAGAPSGAGTRPEGQQQAVEGAGPGVKWDGGKVRMDLLPHAALLQMAEVLTVGLKKYPAENWRSVAGWRWRYYAAALRHLFAWWCGQRLDPDTGLPHLAHALCCVAFLAELDVEPCAPEPFAGSSPPRSQP